MANKKISELIPKGSSLSATDLVEVSVDLRGGLFSSNSVTGQEIKDFAVGSVLSGLNSPNVGGLFNFPTTAAVTGGNLQLKTMVVDEILYIQYIPMVNLTSVSFSVNIQNTVASGLGRISVYDNANPNVNDGRPGSLLYASADLDMSTSGLKSAVNTFNFSAGEVYWLAFQADCTVGVAGHAASDLIPIGVASLLNVSGFRQLASVYSSGAPAVAAVNTFSSGPYPAILIQKQ